MGVDWGKNKAGDLNFFLGCSCIPVTNILPIKKFKGFHFSHFVIWCSPAVIFFNKGKYKTSDTTR